MHKSVSPLENSLEMSYKIEHSLAGDAEILHLGTYPGELEIPLHTKTSECS